MKIILLGTVLFHADLQTGGQTYFANTTKNIALTGSFGKQQALTCVSACSLGSSTVTMTTFSREFRLIFQTNAKQQNKIRHNRILICHFQMPFHPVVSSRVIC
jgi:hypothetical protein